MPRSARMLLLPALLVSLVAWKQAAVEDHPERGLHWCESSIGVLLNEDGSADVTDGRDVEALRDAMAVWNEVECRHVMMVDKGDTSRRDAGHSDSGGNINLITWLSGSEWSTRGPNYVPTALALTTLWYAPSSGRVFDGDIEFNDAHEWTARPQGVLNDVMNTAVHELGHVLGLDHVNDAEATMYTYSSSGELKKRDLEQDDIDGVCAIYHSRYGDCEEGGCGALPGGRRVGWPLLALALAWLVVRGARRPRSTPDRIG